MQIDGIPEYVIVSGARDQIYGMKLISWKNPQRVPFDGRL